MSNKKRGLSADDQKDSNEPPSKRQKISNELIEQFTNSLNMDNFTDIQFIVGTSNKTTFNANKLLFSTQSKVFKAMLFGPMSQSTNNNQPIYIPDVKPSAFNYLHKLFYLKQPQLTYDIIVDVLYAAQKYLIDIVIKE
eukprot:447466_1